MGVQGGNQVAAGHLHEECAHEAVSAMADSRTSYQHVSNIPFLRVACLSPRQGVKELCSSTFRCLATTTARLGLPGCACKGLE